MECGSNYASGFLKYLSDFVANIRPDDPLPVRAPSYKVTESEIDGQILDIVHHYLNSRWVLSEWFPRPSSNQRADGRANSASALVLGYFRGLFALLESFFWRRSNCLVWGKWQCEKMNGLCGWNETCLGEKSLFTCVSLRTWEENTIAVQLKPFILFKKNHISILDERWRVIRGII